MDGVFKYLAAWDEHSKKEKEKNPGRESEAEAKIEPLLQISCLVNSSCLQPVINMENVRFNFLSCSNTSPSRLIRGELHRLELLDDLPFYYS